LLGAVERAIVKAAKHHAAPTLYLWPTVPGLGQLLRLVLLDEMHAIDHFPTVQDVVSYGRLVKCAKASAGKRLGTSGNNIGPAHLTWACAAAATLFWRTKPAAPRSLAR
jgi:transposase